MNNLQASNYTLLLSFVLVVVALLIGYKEKLGIDKDIIISVARAIVQLFIVGYILKFIIRSNNYLLTLAMILVILFNAAWNAKKRGAGIPNIFWISFTAITASTALTLGVLVLTHSVKFIPQQMIPITGMIAGNTMVAIGLCYRSMKKSFHDQQQQVLEKLALGADHKLASMDILRSSIKTGMSPSIDS
ncbi:ABC transporter permease, partial [Lactobacillus acetotolerans]